MLPPGLTFLLIPPEEIPATSNVIFNMIKPLFCDGSEIQMMMLDIETGALCLYLCAFVCFPYACESMCFVQVHANTLDFG